LLQNLNAEPTQAVWAFAGQRGTRAMFFSGHFVVTALLAYIHNANMSAVHRFLRGSLLEALQTRKSEIKRVKDKFSGAINFNAPVEPIRAQQLYRQSIVENIVTLFEKRCQGPSVATVWKIFDWWYETQVKPFWTEMKRSKCLCIVL
jgi:hypothetical protein